MAEPESTDPAPSGFLARVPIFWIGFVVVALARALVAWSRLDDFRGEELYQGTLAWALLKDFPLDPDNLPVIVHLRGSVVFGALTAPVYAVLGASYAALKVIAIVWSGLAGGLLAFVLARGLDGALGRAAARRAALAGVLLAAFFPPAYQMVDASSFGSHMDSVVPTLAALAVIASRPGPLSLGRAILLGLALGCGVFFSLQCVVAAPAVLAAWWGADRGLWRRPGSLGVLAAALPAACIPLISRSTTLVTKSMSDHVLPDGLGGAFAKLGAWFSGDGVRVMLFEVSSFAWLGWLYAACVLLAWMRLAPRVVRLEPLALFAALHPLLVFGAWVISDFELNFVVLGNGMGSRYLMPVMPAIAIAMVLGLSAQPRGRANFVLAVLCGAIGWAGLLDTRPLLDLPSRQGTSFGYFAVHFTHAGAWPERLRLAREVDPDWDAVRPLSYHCIAPEDGLGAPGTPASVQVWKAVQALEPELRPYALVGLGHHAVGDMPTPQRMAGALDAMPPVLGEDEARWYRLGVGRAMMMGGLTAGALGPQKQRAFYQVLEATADDDGVLVGAGFQLGRLFTAYNENIAGTLLACEALGDETRARFLRGVAFGWRMRFREADWFVPEPEAAKIERLLDPADRAAFRAGLAIEPGAEFAD